MKAKSSSIEREIKALTNKKRKLDKLLKQYFRCSWCFRYSKICKYDIRNSSVLSTEDDYKILVNKCPYCGTIFINDGVYRMSSAVYYRKLANITTLDEESK